MRNKILLFALALVSGLGWQNAFAGQGGPDAFGYTWKDSDEIDGPTFMWMDITNAPGAVQMQGLADDNSVGPFAINWDFRYYWTDYNSFKFGSNGWVGFNNIGNIAHCFPTIPTAGGAGDNFLAPFMSDLNFLSSNPAFPNPGEVWMWDNGTDSLIIQWNNVPWWANANPDWVGSNTFQLVLSGVDSSITFNYLDMDPANFNDTPGCPADLEIGMENITGNIGLEVWNETVPADSYAVKFYYPHPITFQVPDAQPSWNANADNAGQFVYAGALALPIDMTAGIENVGNADITNTITIDGELRTLALQNVWTDATSLNGLTAGTLQAVTFPTQATLTQAGQYYYEVATSNGQDINPSNNSNIVEISAVECSNDTVLFTYSTGNPPDGAISWTGGGGNDGCGIYVVPPSYPVTVTDVDLFILGDDGDPNTPMQAGFKVEIYGDNGGALGALLAVDSVSALNTIEDNWNRVSLTSPPVITQDGFFVSWIMGGNGIALGTEAFGPISRRTYEILGGQWAPYRQGSVEDFLMRVKVSTTCLVNTDEADAKTLRMIAYPNPSNGITSVSYELPEMGDVKISLMNMYGQVVREKAIGGLAAGNYVYNFDASALSNGVYFVNLEFNGEKVTQKVVVNN